MDLQTVLIILGVLGIILFLVALVMSYKSWRWHTLLLVWLVFAAACVAMWMSLQTLKAHQSWREILLVNDRDPSAGQPNAVPIEISAENMVTVEFDRPPTYRLEKDLPIYVFSSEPDKKGDQYLGMFQVAEVTGNQAAEGEEPAANTGALLAVLRPQWPVTEAERNRLQKSVENGDLWILNAGLIEKTEALRKENRQLEFGVEDERGRIISPGISQLELKLAALLLDRGRMWTDAKPVEMRADDVVTVEFDQPQTYRLEKDLPVYVFSSDSFLTGGRYLGMFQVTEVTGNQAAEGEEPSAAAGPLRATLRPQWPVAEEEHNRLQNSVENEERWTVYDKMPVDRHLVFAGLEAADLDMEEETFDALDRAARLRKILPERTVQEFLDDYQPARQQHPPARLEEQVEFLEDYPDEDEPVRFVEGQQVWLPQKGAQGTIAIRDSITGGTLEVEAIPEIDVLLQDEIIERVDEDGSPRYSRQLRDYAYLFRDMHRERKRQDFEITEIVLKISEVQNLIGEKQQVIKLFEDEKGRLSRDQQQFIHDQKIIDDLVFKVRNKTTTSNRRLVEIRNETIRLGKQLTTKQLDAVEKIDRRAPDPESSSGSG